MRLTDAEVAELPTAGHRVRLPASRHTDPDTDTLAARLAHSPLIVRSALVRHCVADAVGWSPTAETGGRPTGRSGGCRIAIAAPGQTLGGMLDVEIASGVS